MDLKSAEARTTAYARGLDVVWPAVEEIMTLPMKVYIHYLCSKCGKENSRLIMQLNYKNKVCWECKEQNQKRINKQYASKRGIDIEKKII